MAKLLLVEDDNNLREIYEARLQAEGYTIVSAKDGEEALVVAKAEKPDLVISDVMMPKISGFEMLDIMRNTEELKHVKVIMLTALGQSDDQQRADKLGADRYLVKSQVTLEDIIKVTHELLGDEAGQAAESAAPAPVADAAAATPTPEPTPAPAPAAIPVAEAPAASPASPPATEPAATVPAPEPKPEPSTPAPAPTSPPAAPASGADAAAATPTPEPTPAPAPANDAAKPDAGQAATKADDDAKPAAKEEADLEARIEDFVVGASSEPTAPGGGTPAAPGSPAPPSAAASDDKLMADAVETLVASTDKDKPAKTNIPVTAALDGGQAPAKPTEPAPETVDTNTDGSTGGVKKVIKPLENPSKKDINQLLAEEEAKEVQTTPGSTIGTAGPIEEDKPAGAPMASPSEAAVAQDNPGNPDPGSIAL